MGEREEGANHRTADTGIFNPLLYQLSCPALVLACRGAEGRGEGARIGAIGGGFTRQEFLPVLPGKAAEFVPGKVVGRLEFVPRRG